MIKKNESIKPTLYKITTTLIIIIKIILKIISYVISGTCFFIIISVISIYYAKGIIWLKSENINTNIYNDNFIYLKLFQHLIKETSIKIINNKITNNKWINLKISSDFFISLSLLLITGFSKITWKLFFFLFKKYDHSYLIFLLINSINSINDKNMCLIKINNKWYANTLAEYIWSRFRQNHITMYPLVEVEYLKKKIYSTLIKFDTLKIEHIKAQKAYIAAHNKTKIPHLYFDSLAKDSNKTIQQTDLFKAQQHDYYNLDIAINKFQGDTKLSTGLIEDQKNLIQIKEIYYFPANIYLGAILHGYNPNTLNTKTISTINEFNSIINELHSNMTECIIKFEPKNNNPEATAKKLIEETLSDKNLIQNIKQETLLHHKEFISEIIKEPNK